MSAGVRCRMAAEPPSPLQSKPLPQPQESGSWSTVPPGHELLQSCWCPSPFKPLFLHRFLKKFGFFFPFPLLLFHPHLERENAASCKLHFCLCSRIFFFPIHTWSNALFQFAAQNKSAFLLFLFPNLLKLKGLFCVSSFCCLIFVSTLFSSGSGYGSVLF